MNINFLLMAITDRTMNEPRFFETYEDAYRAMANDFADCLGIAPEDVENVSDETKAHIDDRSAWVNDTCACDMADWHIFDISERNRNIMKNNYLLTIVADRTMDAPRFYETYEDAYQAMVYDFAECLGITPADVKKPDAYDEEQAHIDDSSAWVNDNGACNAIDWNIHDISNWCA